MNLHQLEIFLAVAKHCHFSKAAAEVYLTQSAVSMQIKLLEDELGIPLFDRLGKTTHLTTAGKVLQEHTFQIFAWLQKLYQEIEELKGSERGHIAVGASTTPGIYILPKILSLYNRRYPQITLDYQITDTQQIEQMILTNQLDFAIVGGHLIEQSLHIEPYLTDELIMVVSPDNLITKCKSIKPQELQSVPFVFRNKGSATRKVIEKVFAEQNLKLKIAMELRDPESIKQMVIAGFGATILSKYAVQDELSAGKLLQISTQHLSFTRELVIVTHRDKRLSFAAKSFLQLLRDSKKDML